MTEAVSNRLEQRLGPLHARQRLGIEADHEAQFIDEVVRYYPRLRRDEMRLYLLEAGARIMPEIAEELASYSTRQLSRRAGVSIRPSTPVERITPGHPEQNGRHERMHLTLKETATRPAAANVLQQQARFDDFIEDWRLAARKLISIDQAREANARRLLIRLPSTGLSAGRVWWRHREREPVRRGVGRSLSE